MKQLNGVITGITASLPDYILTNEELATIVDTSDEWIMTRVGIKETINAWLSPYDPGTIELTSVLHPLRADSLPTNHPHHM